MTERLGARLQTATVGFDSRPRPYEDLQHYDGRKGDFRADYLNRIHISVCGPTVYDDAQIGHARTYIAFDVVARNLKAKVYCVF